MPVRPKAVCVCSRDDRILVNAALDAVKGEQYYGPLGGGIEFGERAADAVARELREEIGVAITDVRLLGVLENLFTYEGTASHEIVFVFDARLADASLYAHASLVGEESNGQAFVARWMPLATFAPGGPPLHPDGLYELLCEVRRGRRAADPEP
ncbi:MAG: NUDIX hydrolase [Gemmatirosa sp.]